MRHLGFNLFALLLIALLAVACVPPTSPPAEMPTAVPAATSTPAPPAPPTGVPTLVPAGTSTPVTPAGAYATQEAARQATVVARATASPFPTAGPATVQTGQPSIATTRRDGLSFQIRLPKDTYLAGEGGQAEAILRNDGPETVFVRSDGGLVLLDEQGHEPVPWPWSPMVLPGIPCGPCKLDSGQVITDTLNFQVPPEEQAAGHTYVLWAETSFCRSAPDRPEGWDNLWLHLETGPIPLQVTPPDPWQQLVAELEADRDGWRLRVTDTAGRVPAGPLWGFHEIVSFDTTATGPLWDSADGTWSGAWGGRMSQSDSQIGIRAWVAAPGYVTAAITQTVPGTGDASRWFSGWEPPTPQTFDSLETAQATLDFPLYRPGWLPAGAVLDGVQVETRTSGERRWTNVSQMYRLPDDTWLELIQVVTTEHYASAGWGEARYTPETRPVTVGQNTGYVIQRFDWWVLDWKCDDVGLELRAPVQTLSLENLLTIAEGVKSPEGTCPPAPTATLWISTPPPPPTPTEPPQPTSTPLPTATAATAPSPTPEEAAFPRTSAWFNAYGNEYPTEEQLCQLVEAFSADVIAYLQKAIDPTLPLESQSPSLTQMAADLPFFEGGQVVPVDLDGGAPTELFVVPNFSAGPMLYVRYADAGWQAFPVPVVPPGGGKAVANAPNLWPASAEARDVTGDAQVEAIVRHTFAGASNWREHPQVLRWNGAGFDVLFRAELVNWAGPSEWCFVPHGLAQDIVITYPIFMPSRSQKFDPHPEGVQHWRYDPAANRYVLWATAVQTPSPWVGDLATAEAALQASDYRAALTAYKSFLSDETWQEDFLHNYRTDVGGERDVGERELAAWLDLARLHAGLCHAALDEPTAARQVLSAIESAPQADLAAAFLTAYGEEADLAAALAAYGNAIAAAVQSDQGPLTGGGVWSLYPQPYSELILLNRDTALLKAAVQDHGLPAEGIWADLDDDGRDEFIWLDVGEWRVVWVAWHDDDARWQATGLEAEDDLALTGAHASQIVVQYRGEERVFEWDGELKMARVPPARRLSDWPIVDISRTQ